MDSANFQKIKEVFAEALEKPSKEREDFLREKCAGDAELLAEVKSLLEANDKTEKFIDQNALDISSEFAAVGKHYDGTQFGNYKIVGEIGRGGMGAVFLAERSDGEFEQKVALKIIRQSFAGGELEKHFRRERQILASLNHPNIAKLLDGGVSASGELFLAMEYIEGELLLSYAEHHNLEIKERLNLFLKICRAVSFAHQNLIVHRDIKPANILVGADGEPKLLDFGLARVLSENFASDAAQTETVFRAFTPSYASPEQIRGKNVSTASDVYSLGVVFYELLTGDKPFHFEGKSIEEIMKTATENEPSFPSRSVISENPQSAARISQLKGDLDNIALTALRKEPERRYKSVEAFADDIERHLKGLSVAARPNTVSYRAAKFFGRNKIAVAATAFIITALISGLVIALWQASVARSQRDRAEKRFGDVRKLSNSLLFELAPKIERLPGATEAREILVKRALEYLESLAREVGGDLQLQSELAAAYEKIGELQGNPKKPNLSDYAGAITSYEKANAIRYNLPTTTENQKLLAENFRESGNVRYAQNNVKGCLQDLAEALKIYENLLAANPESFDLQIAFLETRIEVAETHTSNNQFDEAIPMLREAVAALERLDPNHDDTRRLMSKSRSRLAYALSWNDQQAEAEAEMTKALAVAEKLVAENSNDAAFQQGIWAVYMMASGINEGINDEISLQFALKALRTVEKAVASDAADTNAKTNLARTFSRVGILCASLNRIPEAVEYLEKSEKVFLELIKRDPKNLTYQHDLGTIYTRFGTTKENQRDWQGSLKAFHKSAEYYEAASHPDEKNTSDRRNLANSFRSIGLIYLKIGEKEKAKENLQKALEIVNRLKAQNALGNYDKKIFDEAQVELQKLENPGKD